MLEGPENRRFEQFVGPHIKTAERDARNQTVSRPKRLYISDPVKVAANIGVPPGTFIIAEFVIRPAGGQRLARLLGRQHSRQQCVMGPFDTSKIDETRRTANEGSARKDQLRHRLPPSRGDRARAIGYPFASIEGPAHEPMGLEALKLVVRRERRVLVIEMDHKADRNEPVAV